MPNRIFLPITLLTLKFKKKINYPVVIILLSYTGSGAINTNVGDLIGAKIARSSTYILVSEDQVFLKFNFKNS